MILTEAAKKLSIFGGEICYCGSRNWPSIEKIVKDPAGNPVLRRGLLPSKYTYSRQFSLTIEEAISPHWIVLNND